MEKEKNFVESNDQSPEGEIKAALITLGELLEKRGEGAQIQEMKAVLGGLEKLLNEFSNKEDAFYKQADSQYLELKSHVEALEE